MKHCNVARLLPWLLIGVCPPLLGRCGGSVEHGTETNSSVPSRHDEHAAAVSNHGSQILQTSSGTLDAGSTPASDDTADAEIGPPGACSDLRQILAARVSAGFAHVDKTCERDEECAFLRTDSGCYASCEGVVATRSGVQAARAVVVQDIAPLCNEFDSRHCETPTLTCVAGYPVLVCNGVCANLGTLSCDELPARAAARVTHLVNDAPHACSQDDDCALAPADIRCVPSCGNLQSVSASALEGLQRSISATDRLYCDTVESLRCPGPVTLPCKARPGVLPRATCNAGQCEVRYVPQP